MQCILHLSVRKTDNYSTFIDCSIHNRSSLRSLIIGHIIRSLSCHKQQQNLMKNVYTQGFSILIYI